MHVVLNQLTLADLEIAINKARQALQHSLSNANANVSDEGAIQMDLSVLAGLYGKMIYYQQISVPMDLLSDTEQIALLTWAIR
jgi:hypothetical protein